MWALVWFPLGRTPSRIVLGFERVVPGDYLTRRTSLAQTWLIRGLAPWDTPSRSSRNNMVLRGRRFAMPEPVVFR